MGRLKLFKLPRTLEDRWIAFIYSRRGSEVICSNFSIFFSDLTFVIRLIGTIKMYIGFVVFWLTWGRPVVPNQIHLFLTHNLYYVAIEGNCGRSTMKICL